MQIEDVAKEIGQHVAHNPTLVSAMINYPEVTIDKHCRLITKVKGNFPAPHTLTTNLIQGFKAEWQEMGEMQIKSKLLKNYHQKINYPIVPSEILHTYFADYYDEEKDMFTMPISQYIFNDELKPKITDNLEDLSINAVYDVNNADGQYGYSLDGVINVVTSAVSNTSHPAFQIPISALTDSNIVEQVTAFEKQIPSKIKKKVKKIFMSEANAERYWLDFTETYGDNKYAGDSMKTHLGKREIIALPGYEGDMIFATIERNMVKLIDKIDNPPRLTSVQVLDYKVKLFFEFWLGYDFWINELLLVSNYTDTTYGLGTTAKNELYYGITGVSPNESAS